MKTVSASNTNSKTLKGIAFVIVSNVVSLATGIIVGFLIPKMLTLEAYGLVQTTNLYASYLAYIYLGYMDGIILRFAGMSKERLVEEKAGFFIRIGFYWGVVVSVVFVFLSFAFFGTPVFWILLYLGLNILITETNTQLHNIAIMSSRFGKASIASIIFSIVRFLVVGLLALLFFSGSITAIEFWIYILLTLVAPIVSCAIYIFYLRDLLFVRGSFSKKLLKEMGSLFVTGLPLTLGNFVVTLMLESDRQFVQLFFSVEIYAVYAFSYSVLRLFRVFSNGVKAVFFPTIKASDEKKTIESIPLWVSVFSVAMSAMVFSFYIIDPIVTRFLPKYVDTLPIFRVVCSIFLIYSSITVLLQNVYKLKLKNWSFLIKTLISLALAVGLNFGAYFVFGTTLSISIASLVSMSFWFFVVAFPILIAKPSKNKIFPLLYLFGFSIAFVLVGFIPLWWVDFLVMLLLFVVLNVLFCRRTWKYLYNEIERRFSLFTKAKTLLARCSYFMKGAVLSLVYRAKTGLSRHKFVLLGASLLCTASYFVGTLAVDNNSYVISLISKSAGESSLGLVYGSVFSEDANYNFRGLTGVLNNLQSQNGPFSNRINAKGRAAYFFQAFAKTDFEIPRFRIALADAWIETSLLCSDSLGVDSNNVMTFCGMSVVERQNSGSLVKPIIITSNFADKLINEQAFADSYHDLLGKPINISFFTKQGTTQFDSWQIYRVLDSRDDIVKTFESIYGSCFCITTPSQSENISGGCIDFLSRSDPKTNRSCLEIVNSFQKKHSLLVRFNTYEGSSYNETVLTHTYNSLYNRQTVSKGLSATLLIGYSLTHLGILVWFQIKRKPGILTPSIGVSSFVISFFFYFLSNLFLTPFVYAVFNYFGEVLTLTTIISFLIGDIVKRGHKRTKENFGLLLKRSSPLRTWPLYSFFLMCVFYR